MSWFLIPFSCIIFLSLVFPHTRKIMEGEGAEDSDSDTHTDTHPLSVYSMILLSSLQFN